VDDAAAEDANGLPAGLRKRVHHPGSGECPPADATVRFEVVGRRADGTLFLSTRERLPQRWDPSSWSGSKTGPPPGPMRLSLAEPEELLPAWGHILPTMQVGEICEVAAAAPMCYGDEGHERHRISPGEPLFFQFELIDWKERRADKAELSEAARLETATELKARGTEAFKAGELTSASELYQDAADYLLDPPPPPPTETAEEGEARRRGPPPPPPPTFAERVDGARGLLLSCYLNEAQCRLRTEHWREAEARCTLALGLEAKNVKALFRRGHARVKLGEFADARADLREANALDPKAKEIRAMFDECNKEAAAAKQAEKALFAVPFEKASAEAEQYKTTGPPPPEESPEWAEAIAVD